MTSLMRAALPKGMQFNRAKTAPCDLTAPSVGENDPPRPYKAFDYLGYQFSVEDESGKGRSRRVKISIADSKIRRLKTRMLLSFKSYKIDHDNELLIDRIRFIASNYKVKRSGHTHSKGSAHIKSGIYYNYALCGNYKVGKKLEASRSSPSLSALKSLDGMFRGLMKGGSAFRADIMNNMPPPLRAKLSSISFAKGCEDKMLFRVTPQRVSVIKRAWRNA
ncbi:hypothetical protein U1707_14240 [Sphingomonas sp. PB2P12]